MRRWEKVLVALYGLSDSNGKAISYEDLVVAAFKAYPDDFALRGYPQYPDASDIHKPVYQILKPRGLVRIANKTFHLTEAGKQEAGKLLGDDGGTSSGVRLTRRQAQAIDRYMRSAAVKLVARGEEAELIDVDCQRFYGFAAWTKPREAKALREEFLSVLHIAWSVDSERSELLERTDTALHTRFQNLFGGSGNGDST